MQVLVEPFKNGYRARTAAPWDIATEGETEDEALHLLSRMVADRMQSGTKVVELDIPGSEPNPWKEVAGIFKDDPTFDEWQEAIQEYRRQRNIEIAAEDF